MKHISLGENCFTEDFLKKYALSEESGVFSFVGCNIELIIAVLEDDFVNFLSPESFSYQLINSKKYLVNHFYAKETNKFRPILIFGHHNVILRKDHNLSFIRKINRFKSDIKNGDLVFWYHHRFNEKNDINLLISFFEKFDKMVGGNNQYIIFIQKTNEEQKRFHHYKIGKFNIIECYDSEIWRDSNYRGQSFYKQFDDLFGEYNLLNKIS